MITLTDQNFDQEVVRATGAVLVDFWAPWCGPCRILGPIIEELAPAMEARGAKIGKMNVDENQQTASGFGIMSIPTVMIFKGGKVVEQMVGVQSKEVLIEKIEKYA